MKFTVAARSDVGRVRKNNEDSYWVDATLGFFAVADGMGGHAAGEVASREALATVFDTLSAGRQEIENFRRQPGDEQARRVMDLMKRAVFSATYLVYGMGEINPDKKGMGTTVSALLVAPSAAFLAHVGDSRIYIVRQKRIRQLTHDHTLVAEMVEKGRLRPDEASRCGFSNVLTRAVGQDEYVEVDTDAIRFQLGDVFVLCSDGLAGYLDSSTRLLQLLNSDDLQICCDRMIDFALQRGGKDNVTVVLVRVEG